MLKTEGAGFAERQSWLQFRPQVSFNVADTLRGGQTHTRMKDRERDGPHSGFGSC